MPDDLSLRRVKGLPGILPLISAVQKYPAAAKLVVVISQGVGSVSGEKWVHDFVADWNQEFGEEIFEVVEVRGKLGLV